MIDDNMWKYKQFQNPISSQSMSKLANISSSSSSSSNEINNRRKLSSWPIVFLLILPFLLFIILHDYNDSGIGYYSNNNNNGVHSNLDLLNSNSNGDPSNSNNNDNDNNPSSFIQQKQQSNDCICDINNSSNNNNMNSQITKQQQQRIPFIPGEPVYDSDRTIIFLITPTYTRPTQMADMTRLSQTLQLVPDIFWIVVEDAHNKSKSVEDLLRRSNIPYVQLLGPRPATHLDKRSGRGVSNRLRAFEWLRENYSNTTQNGVIYFADDDNAYDIRIFDEMRSTRIVSMFPVGLISTLGLSTPIVSRKSGKIIGFHDPFIGRRKFAVDMAGFAVNLQFFLKQKKSTMPYKVGYEEDYFLKSLGVQVWQLEPKAKNCTEILVWHTKTKPSDKPKLSLMKKIINYNETYLPDLYANQLEQT